MNEVWRSIQGYEDFYEVSSFGRIRRLSDSKIINPQTTEKGYLRVGLFQGNKRKWHKVHRLVAQTFIPNPENKPQINHKDFNKKNNRICNLEWVTNQENARYSMDNMLPEEKPVSKEAAIHALEKELDNNKRKINAIKKAIEALKG